MKEIPLTQGYVALVDDEDYERVMAAGKWQVSITGPKRYAGRGIYIRGSKKRYHRMYLHTFLTGFAITDHINGDGLDNRRANLRPATHAENVRNRRMSTPNKTGFIGVHLHGPSGLYHVQVTKDRRVYSGQYHKTPELAARARDALALELHGEFAVLNFPNIALEDAE